jgi:predicted NAD-dependent protein-ADP-ribosyltransferase YbiA (DUF1768 family)
MDGRSKMDVGSKHGYPASALSNFSPHPFVLDGVQIASMEGFLQSLKHKNPEMQKYICTLVGYAAKRSSKHKNWQRNQTLYWNGIEYDRQGDEYQELLDRAYEAMAGNDSFRRALLASGDAVLTHSIGRTNPKETILTQSEFCRRLMRLRERMKQ